MASFYEKLKLVTLSFIHLLSTILFVDYFITQNMAGSFSIFYTQCGHKTGVYSSGARFTKLFMTELIHKT